ncbi:hypothetical protein WJM97_01810 [Okeanomitos corallinicola TIOX110]|uniref:Uncharacterized protein n=1 Tax=Okeanomitos corallinicola TIOX110 TaxID=3133117 RepID=A0ABZ2UVR9_9CYAN
MALIDGLADNQKRKKLVDNCTTLLDEQVAAKSGISGLAIKAGYAAIKGISPRYCAGAIERLLPESFAVLDPLWDEGLQTGDPVKHITNNSSRTADLLLSITDIRIKKSNNTAVKGVYNKLRNSAKQHIEEAVPSLAKVIDEYDKN